MGLTNCKKHTSAVFSGGVYESLTSNGRYNICNPLAANIHDAQLASLMIEARVYDRLDHILSSISVTMAWSANIVKSVIPFNGDEEFSPWYKRLEMFAKKEKLEGDDLRDSDYVSWWTRTLRFD
ncbi:hypothetical protein RF11_04428 [Thelohanellus kitauei]|uniref:Uncharacterized protein n=1 Tax=Thelohanellus kitauei TaxID=669202 RepID=A0A0C2N1D2_THEKT|nr:hypothetical protein RF11_04428 [Thelohanellus kitauei]